VSLNNACRKPHHSDLDLIKIPFIPTRSTAWW